MQLAGERIKVAREFGDISENSEYDDAKNEQGMVEARIAEIKAMVRTLDMEKCKAVAAAALALESGEAVRRMLAQAWPEV